MSSHLIQQQYALIRAQCVIVTACDAKHAPFLFNALASCRDKFPDHPHVVVYDLGLTALQKHELRGIDGVGVHEVPHFVPHWRLNWSWKLQAMTAPNGRYVLYLDLPNFVVMRSLAAWFVSIARCGYLLVANGQVLGDVTPQDYWQMHGLDGKEMQAQPTFGAGLVGFDRNAAAYGAIGRAYQRVIEGLNLGRSSDEKSGNYQPNIIRNCKCFRADQTLLNLAFRETFGASLQIRRAAPYTGSGGPVDHRKQYLWYARRQRSSLGYLFTRSNGIGPVYFVNRVFWTTRLTTIALLKSVLSMVKRS
jgi:hypothetical protein